MSDSDFQRIVLRFQKLSGILIPDHKKAMVRTRIVNRVRALGFDNFPTYLDHLERNEGNSEHQNFCNALTTNLTSFFREMHHFDHFSAEVGEMAKLGSERLRIWSAGCSTGEEPYSIALTLLLNGQRSGISDTKILATDIDTDVLELAKKAQYERDLLDQIEGQNIGKMVDEIDSSKFEFHKNVIDLISFKQLNLLQNWPMKGPFDIIFCRNVLIYFSADIKAELINRFARMLRPGGVLYLGHSETVLGDHPLLINEGLTTYRKVASG